MVRRKVKTEEEKSISEMTDEVTRATMREVSRDGKLTPRGRSLAKLMDRIMPDEKVDEWGWSLSRKERAEIKRRAAEKKAAEEKKKAEARARAAYRRKQRMFEENGLLEGFVQINWSFMAARDELKRRGFSLELMHKHAQAQGGCRGANLALEQTASRRLRGVLHLPVLPCVQRGADRNASRRPAGTGEEGMGESPAAVQAPRAVAVTGCGEGANVV